MMVIGAALFQAWLARSLSTEFQESKYIFRAITLIVLVIFIAVPVIFLARETRDACIFLGCAMIFVICMGILWLLFLPKMTFKQRKMSVITSYKGGSHVHISGLETGHYRREDVPSVLNSTDLYPSDDCTVSGDGERILATKDRRALAEEVALLKKLLRAKDRREEVRGAPSDSVIGPSDPHQADVEIRATFEASVRLKSDNSMDATETNKNLSGDRKIRDVDTPHV
jgi:hypothetical protein